MAANQALIQGAYAAAPKFSEAGDAFSSAFEGRLQQFNQATEKANAKRDELRALYNTKPIDDLGNTYELSKSASDYFKNKQNEIFDLIKKSNPEDPAVRQAILDANKEVNIAATNVGVWQAATKDLAVSEPNFSKTNDEADLERLKQYFNLKLGKGKNGEPALIDESGNVVSTQELATYPERIIEVPVSIYNSITDTAGKLLKPGGAWPSIEPQLKQMLYAHLRDEAYKDDFLYDSLGGESNPYDKNDPASGVRVSAYKGMTKSAMRAAAAQEIKNNTGKDASENEITSFLQEKLVNGYMRAFKNIHNTVNVPKETKLTQEEINRAEKNKTGEQVVRTMISDFSEAVTAPGGLDFLTKERSIEYKGKTIKAIEYKSDDEVTLVYDSGQGKESAFDIKLTPDNIAAMLASFANRNYESTFDDKAKLNLIKEIKKNFPKGATVVNPNVTYSPYDPFRQ